MKPTNQSLPTHFILSLLLSLIFIGISSQGKITWLTLPVNTILNPLRFPFYKTRVYLDNKLAFVQNLPIQQRLINDLERQNKELSVTAKKAQELEQENQSLKSLLASKISPNHHIISAKIISLARFATLNQGSNVGVTPSLPVVIDDLLVGITTNVDANNTKVRLLNDPDTSIEVTTLSGVNGKLVFQNNTLSLIQVPQKEQLKQDEPLFTAGNGGLPHGLLVGHLTKIDNNESSIYQTAIIKPAAQISQYQYVFILLD